MNVRWTPSTRSQVRTRATTSALAWQDTAIALVRAEPAKAEALLEDLSELFRHALADSQEAVPLSQELATVKTDLALAQAPRWPDASRLRTGLCIGCGRTLQEIARWGAMAETERKAIMGELPARRAALAKEYRYRLWRGRTPPPDLAPFVVASELEVDGGRCI